MAVGILVMLYVKFPALPEITDGLANTHPGGESMPIFPMMFISIACGAISGFHATQSPLMARCMTNEKQGRRIFFGAMIAEGIIALIWATAATYFFQKNGMGISNAAEIVNNITKDWLGTFGGLLAILGVIAAPITSGDTALRSARLMISDMFNFNQKPIKNRLLISAPLFLVTVGILLYSLRDKEGFNIIWRYFAWANQTLAVMTLWTITVYLLKEKKCYWVTLLPALFMTSVVVTYILVTPEGLALSYYLSLSIGIAVSLLLLGLFFYKKIKQSPIK